MTDTPTLEEIRSWGATTDVVRAGAALGLGRNYSYELARTGAFPARVIRIGRSYRVVVADLLTILGAPGASPASAEGGEQRRSA